MVTSEVSLADAAGRAVACPTLPNKMKAKLIPILAAGLFLMPAQPLRASVDCLMSLVANCYYQQKFTSVGTVTTGHVDMVRVDSKQLLLLLEKELNMKFPAGAQLQVATDGKVNVVSSKSVFIADASTYLSATLDDGVRLVDGPVNAATKQENTRNYYPITLTFNFSVLQGSIKGVLLEKLLTTAPDRYGFNVTTSDCTAAVNGSGVYNGKAAYLDGNLVLKGKTTH